MFKKLALATALSMTLVSYQALADDAKVDAPKTAATAPKAGVSIAVINLRYIMSELPQAKAAAEEMKSQFGPRSQELKSIQEKGQKLESQLQTAKGEEVTKIQRQLAVFKLATWVISISPLPTNFASRAAAISFNNIKTKKGRTFLTAFAASIGIIGIALIMSLSNGFQNYIDDLQEETLSSYP